MMLIFVGCIIIGDDLMNILIISPNLYPCLIGGMEIFNYYFAKNLSNFYNISILTNCNLSQSKKAQYIKINKNNSVISMYLNIFIKLMSFRKKVNLLIFPYTSNSPLIYPVFLAHLLFKIPYVIVIHGGGMYPWNPVFFQKKFFMNANDIVAVSKPIKKEYEKRTGRSIKLIPPLIPFEIENSSKIELRDHYNFGCDDKIIICIGSIKEIKGSNILLEAFLKLDIDFVKDNNLKMVYVGDGPLKSKLEEKIQEECMEEYVKFLGKLPHSDVKKIYKMGDIYVIPSLFEGMPISLLEAMFNSLPIIGANVTGINDIIKHEMNGLLFDINNPLDLANLIKYMVSNEKKCLELGNQAKESYDNRFNYSNMIEEYVKIFNEIR